MKFLIKILFCSWGWHPSGVTTVGLDFHHMIAHYECHACGHKWQGKLTAKVASSVGRKGRGLW